jgi:hypothetical protein
MLLEQIQVVDLEEVLTDQVDLEDLEMQVRNSFN